MYRGRLAPSPTGWLHLGHARTFWTARERARAAGGALVLRNEDLDARRFRLEFVDAMMEDLRWFGFQWQHMPTVVDSPLKWFMRAFVAAKNGDEVEEVSRWRRTSQEAQAPPEGEESQSRDEREGELADGQRARDDEGAS